MQVSRHWRLQEQRYSLVGNGNEALKTFPPREATQQKQQDSLFSFSGRGKVYSFTTVYDAPAGFHHMGPYTIALIKLDEGPVVTAQLTDIDPNEVSIDLPVEMVTRKLTSDGAEGMIVYGYKFRPILA